MGVSLLGIAVCWWWLLCYVGDFMVVVVGCGVWGVRFSWLFCGLIWLFASSLVLRLFAFVGLLLVYCSLIVACVGSIVVGLLFGSVVLVEGVCLVVCLFGFSLVIAAWVVRNLIWCADYCGFLYLVGVLELIG